MHHFIFVTTKSNIDQKILFRAIPASNSGFTSYVGKFKQELICANIYSQKSYVTVVKSTF